MTEPVTPVYVYVPLQNASKLGINLKISYTENLQKKWKPKTGKKLIPALLDEKKMDDTFLFTCITPGELCFSCVLILLSSKSLQKVLFGFS